MPDTSSKIKAARKGDSNAFGELVNRYQDGVYRTCLLLLGDEQEALEASQDVFVKAYRSLDTSKQSLFLTRIYRIAIRHAADLRGQLKQHGFERNLEARKAMGDVRGMLAAQGGSDAEIVLLADVERLLPEDVAEILGVSTGEVTSRLSEVRRTQKQPLSSDALTTVRAIKAPPGLVNAIIERLGPEMAAVSSPPGRTASRPLVGLVVAGVLLVGAWAAYHYLFLAHVDMPAQTTGQASSTPTGEPVSPTTQRDTPPVPASENRPDSEGATANPSPVSPETTTAAATEAAPPSPMPSTPPVSVSIPVITLASPKAADTSLPTVLAYVTPRITPPPVREGEDVWVVDLTDAQFWRMHRWLIAHYTRMRIPESAIPGDRARVKVKLKVTDNRPAGEEVSP